MYALLASPVANPITATVLLADGTGGRHTLYRDVHTGGLYLYRKLRSGATVRVYVEPGESVDWLEAPDPVLAALTA